MEAIHLYLKAYNELTSQLNRFEQYLSQDEKVRRAKFYNQELKDRFTLRRGFCRAVLSSFLNSTPEEITYTFNDFGRPYVEELHFSISHRKTHFILALHSSVELGVDLEITRNLKNIPGMMENLATAKEKRILGENKYSKDLFYRWWTGKEAIIKMTGMGLSYPTTSFEVPLEGEGPLDFFLPNENKLGKINYFKQAGLYISLAYDCKKEIPLEWIA